MTNLGPTYSLPQRKIFMRRIALGMLTLVLTLAVPPLGLALAVGLLAAAALRRRARRAQLERARPELERELLIARCEWIAEQTR